MQHGKIGPQPAAAAQDDAGAQAAAAVEGDDGPQAAAAAKDDAGAHAAAAVHGDDPAGSSHHVLLRQQTNGGFRTI